MAGIRDLQDLENNLTVAEVTLEDAINNGPVPWRMSMIAAVYYVQRAKKQLYKMQDDVNDRYAKRKRANNTNTIHVVDSNSNSD